MTVNPYSQLPYSHTSLNVPNYSTGADQPFNPPRAAPKEHAQHRDGYRVQRSYLSTPSSSASSLGPSPSPSASPVTSASSPYANVLRTVKNIPEVEGNSTAVPTAPLKDKRLTKVEKRKAVKAFGLPIHPDEPAAKKLNTFEIEISNDLELLDCCKVIKRGKLRRHQATDKHRKAWAATKNADVPVLRKFTCRAVFCDASYTVKINADRHQEKCIIYKAEAEIRNAAKATAAAARASAGARFALYSQLNMDSAPFMAASASNSSLRFSRRVESTDIRVPSLLVPAVEQSDNALLAPDDLYHMSASPPIPHTQPVPLSSWSSLAGALG